MSDGFDGLVDAVEQGDWDEVRTRADELAQVLRVGADAGLRATLSRLDPALREPDPVPLLAAVAQLLVDHGWDGGALRIDRQRLAVCEERLAVEVSDRTRSDLALAMVDVARGVPAEQAQGWFARALATLDPIGGAEGARLRAQVHAAAGEHASEEGDLEQAVDHHQAAVDELRPHDLPRELQVALGLLTEALARLGEPTRERLDERITAGRRVAAAADPEPEALAELALDLERRVGVEPDPQAALALAEELLAVRGRLGDDEERAREELAEARRLTAEAAEAAGRPQRAAELRGG